MDFSVLDLVNTKLIDASDEIRINDFNNRDANDYLWIGRADMLPSRFDNCKVKSMATTKYNTLNIWTINIEEGGIKNE